MRFKGWLTAFVTVGVLVCGVPAAADVGSGSGPPTAIGTGGAAATVERLATQAAVDILRRGGNAVDAAVASAAVLGVTEPFSCGIGGGGFMVVRTAGGRVTTIDGRETAPTAMHADVVLGERRAACPSTTRATAVSRSACPGTVATWADALERYGTMTLAEVLAPAIHVARHGFVVDQTLFDQTNANRDWFDDIPASAALFLDPGRHSSRRRHRLHESRTSQRRTSASRISARRASTAARSRMRSSTPFSTRSSRPTANHVWRSGVMTMRDLHTYAAPERAPTHVNYRGLDVYSMGPPSSGGSTVGEALNILEGYNALVDDERGARCTTTSRRRATRSPTATRTSPIRTTSTCR